jgi:hypothetical protein
MKQRLRLLRFLLAASGGYLWRSLKKGVKILLGRPVYFDEPGLFLWQCILHLTGLRKIRTVTCVRRLGREGPGSQALAIMNAINFARISGLTYVHTPFIQIHGGKEPMQDWVAAWEGLFNLGDGEVACDVKRHQVVNYCHNFVDLELCLGWRDRRVESALAFKANIPEFRRKYYRNRSPRTTREVTVAVNIRRGGDVSAALNPIHFTPTETVLQIATAVKSILDAQNISYRIDVYSNGHPGDFLEFSQLGARIFINPDVDIIWTMQELIEADVLIVAKSSFSYYAAHISDGIKIFEPLFDISSYQIARSFLAGWAWWYLSPAADWLPCGADGSFDRAAFEGQLLLLKQAKAMGTAEPGGVNHHHQAAS